MVNGMMPTSLREALELLSTGEWIPYAGGTDLMPRGKKDAAYLFLGRVPELRGITEDREMLRIGAAVTFSEALEHPAVPPVLKEALAQIAAPAIRNRGTFGGNLANGSSKADTLVVEAALDAKVRLVSLRGERSVSAEEFQLGHKKTALSPDELIAEILIPQAVPTYSVYEKIGGRRALAIARVSFAGTFQAADGHITNMSAAFGAVSDRVQRYHTVEEILLGKTRQEAVALREDWLKAYEESIEIREGHVSADYRRRVCRNLLSEFHAQSMASFSS